MPSMSDSFSPASAMALSAASACSWICDMFGMTPSSVVSAAPTTATWLLRMSLSLRRAEQRKGDRVIERLECDLELHVEFERLRRLRAIDDIAHHPRSFRQFDPGDCIRRREAGHRAMMDHIAVQRCLATGLEHADLARGARRTERTRREVDI